MIVLDTHVVIWLLSDPDRLTEKARSAIQSSIVSGETPAISCQSFYEIARGIVRGRMRVHSPLANLMESIAMRFDVIPLTAQIARLAAEFDLSFPGDPFDRIIAASAVAKDAPLVTADKNILRSNEVKTIW